MPVHPSEGSLSPTTIAINQQQQQQQQQQQILLFEEIVYRINTIPQVAEANRQTI